MALAVGASDGVAVGASLGTGVDAVDTVPAAVGTGDSVGGAVGDAGGTVASGVGRGASVAAGRLAVTDGTADVAAALDAASDDADGTTTSVAGASGPPPDGRARRVGNAIVGAAWPHADSIAAATSARTTVERRAGHVRSLIFMPPLPSRRVELAPVSNGAWRLMLAGHPDWRAPHRRRHDGRFVTALPGQRAP